MKDARTLDEQAEDAKAFCEAVIELADERNIKPSVMLTLFGLIAKSVIDERIEAGMDKGDAMQQGIGFLMNGLGFSQAIINDNDNDTHHH